MNNDQGRGGERQRPSPSRPRSPPPRSRHQYDGSSQASYARSGVPESISGGGSIHSRNDDLPGRRDYGPPRSRAGGAGSGHAPSVTSESRGGSSVYGRVSKAHPGAYIPSTPITLGAASSIASSVHPSSIADRTGGNGSRPPGMIPPKPSHAFGGGPGSMSSRRSENASVIDGDGASRGGMTVETGIHMPVKFKAGRPMAGGGGAPLPSVPLASIDGINSKRYQTSRAGDTDSVISGMTATATPIEAQKKEPSRNQRFSGRLPQPWFPRTASMPYAQGRASRGSAGSRGSKENTQLFPIRIGWRNSARDSKRKIPQNVLYLMEGAGEEEDDELKKIRSERIYVTIGGWMTISYLVLIFSALGLKTYDVWINQGYLTSIVYFTGSIIITPFSLFFYKMVAAGIVQVIGPIKQLKRNSQSYSCYAPDPPEGKLPKITIQMPVYKESLNQTIKPSVESIYRAIWYYRAQGGEAQLYINDDGLQVLGEEPRRARIAFYEANSIAYIARPPENRKGLFKKASNMNYCLNVSSAVEELVASSNVSSSQALATVRQKRGNEFLAGGDVTIGSFILLIDSDTRVPEKCLYQTVGEFSEERLAYTQHLTTAMPLGDSHWDDMISYFTNMVYEIGIRTETANGDLCPLVGHNAILRWDAIKKCAINDGSEPYTLYWSENNVSEDFDLSLRLHIKGYMGRYVVYTGREFQEGVSLTFHDEMIRLRKYAYGACEVLLNPFKLWLCKGPISMTWIRFLGTRGVRWSSKVNIFSYLSSYLAMAVAIYFLPAWYLMVAFTPEYAWGLDAFRVFIGLQIVFTIITPISLSIYIFRLEANKMTLFRILWRQIKFVPLIAALFTGVMFHLTTATLSYMASVKIVWGATVKEIPDTNFFLELRLLLIRYWKMYIVMCLLAAFATMMMYFGLVPVNVVYILPVSFYVGFHTLAPVLLNPYLVRIEY